MFCDQVTKLKLAHSGALVKPLLCRRWTCDTCAPIRQRRLRAEAYEGEPDTFITLTCNPARWSSPDEAARGMVRAWQALVRRIRKEATRPLGRHSRPADRSPPRGRALDTRRSSSRLVRLHPDGFQSLVVMERTDQGWPHLHVLARAIWIDQAWLSQQWAELTGAPVVDVRRIARRRAAARYVAKYCAKEPARFKGCKRYWRSRNYARRPRPPCPADPYPHEPWLVWHAPHARVIATLTARGLGAIARLGPWWHLTVPEKPP